MHTEGHDMGKDVAGNTPPAAQAPKYDSEHPGYETTDVHVRGIAVFLAGLFGTVILFFVFCYVAGRLINTWNESSYTQDYGQPGRWNTNPETRGKGANLSSNAAIEQRELAQVTASFPEPRLDIDDGNQATADLHAREDLLLDHYSRIDGQTGTIRIPIARAMQLLAQQGLPTQPSTSTPDDVAYASRPPLRIPLTTGFARTGYELTVIEARQQKMEFEHQEPAHAELAPVASQAK